MYHPLAVKHPPGLPPTGCHCIIYLRFEPFTGGSASTLIDLPLYLDVIEPISVLTTFLHFLLILNSFQFQFHHSDS